MVGVQPAFRRGRRSRHSARVTAIDRPRPRCSAGRVRERDARFFGALVVAPLLACGPEAPEHAVLEPVCGHESPWRILELAEDEAMLTTGSGLQRIGERIYY